jgi:hypothetical protein
LCSDIGPEVVIPTVEMMLKVRKAISKFRRKIYVLRFFFHFLRLGNRVPRTLGAGPYCTWRSEGSSMYGPTIYETSTHSPCLSSMHSSLHSESKTITLGAGPCVQQPLGSTLQNKNCKKSIAPGARPQGPATIGLHALKQEL